MANAQMKYTEVAFSSCSPLGSNKTLPVEVTVGTSAVFGKRNIPHLEKEVANFNH